MKITRRQLLRIITETILLEGQAEDIVEKFPELKPAYDAGIKNPQYLQWIQKRRAGEPVEDIVGVVQAFDAVKQRLKAKGMSPDIYAYKTPAVLRQALEDLGGSKGAETRRLKDEETTYLGTFGEWIVAMPHTRESSCQLGKGTTWCTAATQSQNLFLSYVGRKGDNIILYYIMKKGSDPRQDPTAKLSIGFVNGEPVLNGRDGHVSVDAQNKGLDQRRLSQILGDQFEPIMTAMKENTSSIGGKHPARKQIEQIAKSKDPSVIDKYTQGMGRIERGDFLKLILGVDPSPQVLAKLSDDEVYIRYEVAKNPSTPRPSLDKLSGDDFSDVRLEVAKNPSTRRETLVKLFGDEDIDVRYAVTKNPSTPPEALVKLSPGHEGRKVRRIVAAKPSTPPELLDELSGDKDIDVRYAVAKNSSTRPETLDKLSGDEDIDVRYAVAKNPSTPPETLDKLSGDEDIDVRYAVSENSSTRPETLVKLFGDEDKYVRWVVANNPTFIAYKNSQIQNINEMWLKIAGLIK